MEIDDDREEPLDYLVQLPLHADVLYLLFTYVDFMDLSALALACTQTNMVLTRPLFRVRRQAAAYIRAVEKMWPYLDSITVVSRDSRQTHAMPLSRMHMTHYKVHIDKVVKMYSVDHAVDFAQCVLGYDFVA